MPLPLIPIGLAAAVVWAGAKLLGKPDVNTPRNIGSMAQVGDDIYVSLPFLDGRNLAEAMPGGKLPPGTLYVIIKVKSVDNESLFGPVIAFGDQRIPAEIGWWKIRRNDIFKLVRNGKVIAETKMGIGFGAEG